MKTLKTLALATAVSAGLLASAGAFAVPEQGTIGATSTGKFEVKFVRDGNIVIQNLADITLPKVSNAGGDLIAWDTVCVGATTASGYSITAVNTTGQFQLVNGTSGNSETADYSIHYADGISNPASVTLDTNNELPYGTTKTGFTPASGTTCADDTSTVWVKLASANIPTVDGTYTDTVTLTVAPE